MVGMPDFFKWTQTLHEKIGYEEMYDNSSKCHFGFGRAIDVDYQDIYENDLILNSIFYRLLQNETQKVTSNDIFIRIKDLISITQYDIPYIPDVKKWDKIENFSDNIGRVLTHEPMDMTESDKDPNSIEIGFLLPIDSIAINPIRSNCHFMWNSTEEPIFIVGADYLRKSQKVITYNKDIVDGAYITQLLMRSLTDRNLVSLSVYLQSLLGVDSSLTVVEAERLKVAIPGSQKDQEAFVNKIRVDYFKRAEAELAAQKERNNIRTAHQQLKHILRAPIRHQKEIIKDLIKMVDKESPIAEKIKELNYNQMYLERSIRFTGENISEANILPEKIDIVQLLKSYVKYRQGFYKYCLTMDCEVNGDIPQIEVDPVFINFALDAIVGNAERHGFNKSKNKDGKVLFSICKEMIGSIPYVKISIKNNGTPLPDDFSVEDYRALGVKKGPTGNTGVGGNHVSEIVEQLHHGKLAIASDKEWNVVIEIYLKINIKDER